jgi:hypothetical protein
MAALLNTFDAKAAFEESRNARRAGKDYKALRDAVITARTKCFEDTTRGWERDRSSQLQNAVHKAMYLVERGTNVGGFGSFPANFCVQAGRDYRGCCALCPWPDFLPAPEPLLTTCEGYPLGHLACVRAGDNPIKHALLPYVYAQPELADWLGVQR